MKYAIAVLTLLLSIPDIAMARGRGYSRGVTHRSGTSTVRRARRITVSRAPARRQVSRARAGISGTNRTFTSRRSFVSRKNYGGGSSRANVSARSQGNSRASFSSFRNGARRRLSRPTFRRAGEEESEEEGPAPVLGRRIVTSHRYWSSPGGPSRIHETNGGTHFINPSRGGFQNVGAGKGVHWGAPDTVSSSGNSGASGNTGITPRQ